MSAKRNSIPLDATYPVRRMLDLIGDKWTPVVLYCLSGGVRRFSELHRQIPDISKKMLIQVLRSLETDGFVERTVYPVVPPKTEYQLTAQGRLLHQPVAACVRQLYESSGQSCKTECRVPHSALLISETEVNGC